MVLNTLFDAVKLDILTKHGDWLLCEAPEAAFRAETE